MKNEQVFKKELNDSVAIKKEIDNEMSPIIRSLSKIFKKTFGSKNFKFISGLLFYKGGWPKPETRAKLDVLVEDFAIAAYYMKIFDNDRFEKCCKKYGIKIEYTEPIEEIVGYMYEQSDKELASANKEYNKIFNEDLPNDNKLVMDNLFKESFKVLSDICENIDEIKIDKAEKVESQCEVDKSMFMKTVIINASENKDKNKEKEIKKAEKIKLLMEKF